MAIQAAKVGKTIAEAGKSSKLGIAMAQLVAHLAAGSDAVADGDGKGKGKPKRKGMLGFMAAKPKAGAKTDGQG